jgi:hypothetical protein
MFRIILLWVSAFIPCCQDAAAAVPPWPGYVDSGFQHEQGREIRFAEDCRAIVLASSAEKFDPEKPTLLVVYATPNGNTAEQTLGCQMAGDRDWHFDIQHAAAQWRMFRDKDNTRNVVLACVQANNLSWPAWKGQHPHGPQYIRQIVESLAASLPSKKVSIVLTGHSGGGSFIFGFIDAVDEIPASLERIAFLDANYGYDTSQHHGEKILKWLGGHQARRFVVLAYDDRNIELDGKKVVSPTGGTYRATERMLEFLKERGDVSADKQGEFARYRAVDGRLTALVHPNLQNKILHTQLVGEMNGLFEVLAIGTAYDTKEGKLAPPRRYTNYIQPNPLEPTNWRAEAPALRSRPTDAKGGSEVGQRLLDAEPAKREETIAREILEGNIPNFWRQFREVTAEIRSADGGTRKVAYRVSPDYLAVGSDDDFVRVPLTPYIAQQIADMLGCVLPTRKMVDDIYRSADAKCAPHPLTEERESLATFLEHHKFIEAARPSRHLGELIAGIKKDVVVTNELLARPGRVAIYGWHKLDGKPIQPLTTVHVDSYVDYSHGIRLVDQWCEVDGQPLRVEEVWRDKELCPLLSDEGPLERTRYHRSLEKP